MIAEREFRNQEVQIARYRSLEREVTDPLAASLIQIIILELEAALQSGPEASAGASTSGTCERRNLPA